MFGKRLKEYDTSKEALENLNYAKVSTNKGDIWLKLFKDEVPNTVANFAHLADSGFYDGLKFHRVIQGFMAQAGCPHSKNGGRLVGTGGPDWAIACETEKNTHKHKRGVISMAHAGKDTGGSQFFICFVDCPHLDGVHTVFGEIEDSDSFKVLDDIDQNDEINSIRTFKSKE